jgi:3-dehydroquinate synthase
VKTVHVELSERGYNINIGAGVSPGNGLASFSGRRILQVSDTNVDPLYGDGVEAAFREKGLEVRRLVLPAGEETKALDRVRDVYDAAFEAGLDRSSMMAALGGGVIGDLVGFAAATFLRGIRFVQVPTTLLAMVDSSVGGKTGVNVPQGKNLVGAFYQPISVTADLSTLSTLPKREYVAGLAEVIKYGVIWDATLFAKLEAEVDALNAMDAGLLEVVVARCCEIKSEVVAVDERESGVRAILNFGHTLGHALEKVLGYGDLLHGEAVAIGMVYASCLSVMDKGMPAASHQRLVDLLKKVGLPTGIRGVIPDWKGVREAMSVDKKSLGSVPRLVLAEDLGRVVFGCEVDDQVLSEAYNRALGSHA